MWTGGRDFSTGGALWTFRRQPGRRTARVRTEPVVDESVSQELIADLRETRSRLEAAQADAATLRVLLATRTHQHDLAWQTVQHLSAELSSGRAEAAVTTGQLADELVLARERFAAAETVLGAVAESLGWRGLDRRRFQDLILDAGRAVPESGPQAVRHGVLLDGARRVLGIARD